MRRFLSGRKVRFLLCAALCASLILCACASGEKEQKDPEAGQQTVTETPAQTGATNAPEATATPTPVVAERVHFSEMAAEADRLVREAVEQYNADDYTPLAEPVQYNVLWIGFTHVTYGELSFQMTDFDREYLAAVALNFEKSVEKISGHNVDITVKLVFVDGNRELTQWPGEDWLYLAQETVQQDIAQYAAGGEFDTVLTTVQTSGDENRARNADKEGFGVNDVILGLQTADMSTDMGYSTFNLTQPSAGTWPLADPEVPSLYATAVAVHEWMHQLEYLKKLLGVEYPNTHAYHGPEEFPGYQKYEADVHDYDFFEFYKLVLQGKLPYTQGDTVKLVGMYPKMWPLIKRNVYNLGEFVIRSADGQGYLSGKDGDPGLSLQSEPCVWNLRYAGGNRFEISPKEYPTLLIDLSNAWDAEGNTIGLCYYTGYIDAQSWYLSENEGGTYAIRTPYESGRILTVPSGGLAQLCTPGAEGEQRWVIEEVGK
jgi:hypothetical protein